MWPIKCGRYKDESAPICGIRLRHNWLLIATGSLFKGLLFPMQAQHCKFVKLYRAEAQATRRPTKVPAGRPSPELQHAHLNSPHVHTRAGNEWGYRPDPLFLCSLPVAMGCYSTRRGQLKPRSVLLFFITASCMVAFLWGQLLHRHMHAWGNTTRTTEAK